MSVLIAVRVPDDLVAKIDKAGKRTTVVLAALRHYLDAETPVEPAQRIRKPSASDPRPSCPRCGESAMVVTWGSGLRCTTCALNF